MICHSLPDSYTEWYFSPATFLLPVLCQEFLSYVCIVLFHFQFTFVMLEYIQGTVSLYLCIILFWGQMQPALQCEGFLVVHWGPMDGLGLTFFIPVGVVISLTYSPYPFLMHLMIILTYLTRIVELSVLCNITVSDEVNIRGKSWSSLINEYHLMNFPSFLEVIIVINWTSKNEI